MPSQPELSSLCVATATRSAFRSPCVCSRTRVCVVAPSMIKRSVPAVRCICTAVLALHGFYEKPGFVHYLEYLLYWKRPEYAKFVMYPHALTFLSLLQDESYRLRVGFRPPAFISRRTHMQRNVLRHDPVLLRAASDY